MLVGHMDIVPADINNSNKPIHPTLIKASKSNGFKEYIATDGTTTLGADDKELQRIKQEIKRIKEKYKDLEKNLKITISINEVLPPWNGKSNSFLARLLLESAQKIGHNEVITSPMHGSTQANLLVRKKNHYGKNFVPIIIGPTLFGEHSVFERVEWKSMVELSSWLYEFIKRYKG